MLAGILLKITSIHFSSCTKSTTRTWTLRKSIPLWAICWKTSSNTVDNVQTKKESIFIFLHWMNYLAIKTCIFTFITVLLTYRTVIPWKSPSGWSITQRSRCRIWWSPFVLICFPRVICEDMNEANDKTHYFAFLSVYMHSLHVQFPNSSSLHSFIQKHYADFFSLFQVLISTPILNV